ncbi:MAG: alkaline phosphatase family protein [Deltaproteobacteria bacterium]|nr:alkaline phosphatase family protein [Deltaproteobacteria bacterium]
MPANVMVIGLDAAEATLIERWTSDGGLPALKRFFSGCRTVHLTNSLDILPGAIWHELATGRSCGKAPLYFHPRQLRTGESRPRPIRAEDIFPEDFFWNIADRSGCKTLAFDMPMTSLDPDSKSIQVVDWGPHDRISGAAGHPPELFDELVAKYGSYPVAACDRHGRKRPGYEQLLEGLIQGARQKTDIALDFLKREYWDLFTCVYGETHCAGHQFWHFQDPGHGWYEPSAPDHLQESLKHVYSCVDEGVGALVEKAGPEANVLIVASHGMGPVMRGPQLLPEVLVRLGMGSGGGKGLTSYLRRLQRLVSHAPRKIQPLLQLLAHKPGIRSIERASGCLVEPLDSPRTRAVALENDTCGAIRLNLKGREPNGSVAPGREADTLIEELRRELLALREPATDQSIVKNAVTAVEAFGPDHHPDVPDLMVAFRTDLGPLESCVSESLGHIHVPIFHPNIPRSGEHNAHSRLWCKGPAFSGAAAGATGSALDLAPTVLRLLGLPLPETLDGKPLVGNGS